MPTAAPSSYNATVSEEATAAEEAEEAGTPVAPIPLPPDPLGRWLGPRPDPAAPDDPTPDPSP